MVPWPLALLTLFYGVVATVSASSLWQALAGVSGGLPLWPALWLAAAGGAMVGLPLLKRWGRTLALATSVGLLVTTLALAAAFIAGGRPGAGLAVTLSAAFHALTLRYLRRPVVRAYFT